MTHQIRMHARTHACMQTHMDTHTEHRQTHIHTRTHTHKGTHTHTDTHRILCTMIGCMRGSPLLVYIHTHYKRATLLILQYTCTLRACMYIHTHICTHTRNCNARTHHYILTPHTPTLGTLTALAGE